MGLEPVSCILHMTATMKSRVLTREEKGIGGVSMKRMIFCGMGGSIIYFVFNLSPLKVCSLPALAVVFMILILASGQRYGIPRYQWLQLSVQSRFLLSARTQPEGITAQLASQLNLSPDALQIHAGDLFVGEQILNNHVDLSGVRILANDEIDAVSFEFIVEDQIEVYSNEPIA